MELNFTVRKTTTYTAELNQDVEVEVESIDLINDTIYVSFHSAIIEVDDLDWEEEDTTYEEA